VKTKNTDSYKDSIVLSDFKNMTDVYNNTKKQHLIKMHNITNILPLMSPGQFKMENGLTVGGL
jgi:hypothetical protein